MKMNGAEILIRILMDFEIKVIAGIPGGANLPIYNALHGSSIQHVLARHEQGAGFIAQGMARVSGKPAVCFATSGPGATNLLTAIADAKLDSVPVIAITGQVPTNFIGTDAFQEVDTYGMSIPITKHNFLIKDAMELFKVIPEAFKIAQSGRPGPVLIDIPKDVQKQIVEFNEWPQIEKQLDCKVGKTDQDIIYKIAEKIHHSKKPLLYIGAGIINSQSGKILKKIAERNSIPVVSTLLGLGAFPADHHLFLGMLGMHGARYTNYILNDIDLLIALGVRFDDRATGKVDHFCPQAEVIHIDIDQAEINKIRKSSLSVTGNLSEVLESLEPLVQKDNRKDWLTHVFSYKKVHPLPAPACDDLFNPRNLIMEIAEIVGADAIISTDVGQHQMWAAQYYPFKKPRKLLTSGGLGTMGFGLPAAIGAAISEPKKTVVVISGDGSILMNIQELATLAELDLRVKIIIFNNQHLGLVRQQQELFYEQNYIATKFHIDPDFVQIGSSFGLRGFDLNQETDPRKSLIRALNDEHAWVINVSIHPTDNVTPIVPPGAGNQEMIGGES